MARKLRDYTGEKFGRLTVVDQYLLEDNTGYKRTFFECECSCGEVLTVRSNNVLTGRTQSCGCLLLEKLKQGTRRTQEV